MLVKKMIRDIKSNLSQFIAIFLMVMIGVMAYTGIEAYMGGMQHTADKFYSENNLFDLVSIGENFTDEDLEKVKSLDNEKENCQCSSLHKYDRFTWHLCTCG